MAHTHSHIALHIVFSTRKRAALLRGVDLSALAAVMGGICRKHGSTLLASNGCEDHMHLLVSIRPSVAVADLVRALKSNTSNWIHETYGTHGDFAWQSGYSVFSVSLSAMEDVNRYIVRQAEHHREMSFEEELAAILKKHDIQYDERFVFDS
jgi:REP element-mobilizing transposase RayT